MSVTSLLSGLGLGLALIAAIGAQNAFILRQGIRREHMIPIIAICVASDVVLIFAGVAGIGLLLESAPWIGEVMRWAGAAFLIGYGLRAAWRAWRPGTTGLAPAEDPERDAQDAPTLEPTSGETPTGGIAVATRTTGSVATKRRTLATAILTTLALTWLNPHVYLDSIILLGTASAAHGDGRWAFGIGAALGSIIWFVALGFGARALSRVLRTPTAWRFLDAGIALVMLTLGTMLAINGV